MCNIFKMWNTGVYVLWLLLLFLTVVWSVCNGEMQFCSFFNNRKPSPQPGLRNCTWFKANSCCKQEEIDATFGTVKPLAGSSLECQRYTNYLMCYICAPYQNIFYGQESLTVCEEFCNAWYSACSSAILKGSVIGELYKSGREFCLKRNFQCQPVVNNSCFTLPMDLDISNSSRLRPNIVFLVFVCCITLTFYSDMLSSQLGISPLLGLIVYSS